MGNCSKLSFPPNLIWALLTTIAFESLQAQEPEVKDFRYYYQTGLNACDEGHFSICLDQLSRSNQLRPGHQIIMYQLARAFALTGSTDSSLHYLARAISIKADLNLEDSAFLDFSEHPDFQTILRQQQQLLAPVNESIEFLKLTERDLHIESIAYDTVSNRVFLGSVRKRKILMYKPDQDRLEEFVSEAQDDIGSVFGMKIDHKRNLLWVCSVTTAYMKPPQADRAETAAVYKYNLHTHLLEQIYRMEEDSLDHWFGDLTLHEPSGDVYISDSRSNNIYRIPESTDQLELFLSPQGMLSLQGLDFDDEGRYLFISDYVQGIYRIDLQTKSIIKIKEPGPPVSLKAVDGLYYFQNSLIATQNQVSPMRVSRYYLNDDGTEVVKVKYLEKGNPILDEPTLGVIAGGKFYYVATSQWSGYLDNYHPKPWEELKDIFILKVDL